MKTLDIDPFLSRLEEFVDTLIKEVKNVNSSLHALSEKNLYPIDETLRFKQITNQEVLSHLSTDGFKSKKIERIFWTRFFQFDCNFPEIRSLNPKLSNSRVTNIILRSINFETVKNQKDHLVLLDELIVAPEYIGKWVNLISNDKMKQIALSTGEDILNGKRSDIIRKSKNVAAYILGLYFFFKVPCSELEKNLPFLRSHELFPFLDPIGANVQNVVNVVNYVFIASLLKSYRDQDWKDQAYIPKHLLEIMRLKSFGDPRVYPLNINWANIKDIEPDGFFNWQKSFNEEDIVFFFKELNKVHEERKEFWLQYKSSPDKVILLLDEPTHKQLLQKFNSNEKALEIIKRSYKYSSRASKDQLLIIFFFPGLVIVEGSASGFGCQFFNYDVFKKKFFTSFFIERKDNIIDEDSFEPFRGLRSGRELMKPHTSDWQSIFQNELASRNIKKDKILKRNMLEISIDPSDKTIGRSDLIKYLISNGLEIIDMRPKGGKLWVIDAPAFKFAYSVLKNAGHVFEFVEGGGRASGNRSAWYLKS